MSIAPLPDHIDHKDQYLAFVDLQHFGLSSEPSDDSLTIPQLRDTIQLYLLQQSEYLRRLCLSACVKVVSHGVQVYSHNYVHVCRQEGTTAWIAMLYRNI